MNYLPGTWRDALAAARRTTWRDWLTPRPTHLAARALSFSTYMRWLTILAAPILLLLNPWGLPDILWVLGAGLVYTGLLTVGDLLGQRPPIWLMVLLDMAFITALLV